MFCLTWKTTVVVLYVYTYLCRLVVRFVNASSSRCGFTQSLKQHWVHLSTRFVTNTSLWVLMLAYILVLLALGAHRLYSLLPAAFIDGWYCIAKVAGNHSDNESIFTALLYLSTTAIANIFCCFWVAQIFVLLIYIKARNLVKLWALVVCWIFIHTRF